MRSKISIFIYSSECWNSPTIIKCLVLIHFSSLFCCQNLQRVFWGQGAEGNPRHAPLLTSYGLDVLLMLQPACKTYKLVTFTQTLNYRGGKTRRNFWTPFYQVVLDTLKYNL